MAHGRPHKQSSQRAKSVVVQMVMLDGNYLREADAPVASSRSTLKKPSGVLLIGEGV